MATLALLGLREMGAQVANEKSKVKLHRGRVSVLHRGEATKKAKSCQDAAEEASVTFSAPAEEKEESRRIDNVVCHKKVHEDPKDSKE